MDLKLRRVYLFQKDTWILISVFGSSIHWIIEAIQLVGTQKQITTQSTIFEKIFEKHFLSKLVA